MQHLFNRIYISPLSRIEQQGQDAGAVIFITANPRITSGLQLQNSDDFDDTLLGLNRVRFNIEVGELLFHHPTFDDMLSTRFEGSYDTFFQFLRDWSPSRRLVIYADFPLIEKFMLCWMKTILPNITETTANTLLHLLSLRERLLAHGSKLSITVPIGRTADALSPVSDEDLTFSHDPTLWQTATSFNLNDTPLELSQLGLEFLLATHLHNVLNASPDAAVESLTSEKVLRFVKKRLVYSLMDDKEGITQSLYHAEELFGEPLDFTDPAAIAAFVSVNPQHAWLFDNDFTSDNYVTVWSNYNIAEVFTEGNLLIQKIGKETGVYNTERFDVLRQVFKNDVTLQDVIDVEMAPHFSCLILAAEVTDKALNRYFLDYIFKLYRDGNVTTLQELSVV